MPADLITSPFISQGSIDKLIRKDLRCSSSECPDLGRILSTPLPLHVLALQGTCHGVPYVIYVYTLFDMVIYVS